MSKSNKQLVINYVPGEECRVAVTDDSRLEELHAERMDNASHVGNIYVGKVVNVEPAIQAAFVDFGLEANGFLHVTDLHPRYFPGEDQETTERVGKKTPRRERPPIQACLRRGQEIAVQVLKEGVGSKGPTVTSYLSIPGRFLVMMPLMDKVGVSRKVEDEETRRKMRDILDQLDLPEGFGFILRTAGMDRGKMELKRDLAYLQRLWKDMEKRWKSGNKPRLLYSESDLLVRSLRDILTTDIDRVVIDNEAALNRASRFLKIVAPRTSTKLVRYTGNAPLFHAMGIEQQINTIHAREVPLPGGGRLVIDETEALVAIDVNSGKMRDAKDAETTAYRTNMEAADEIARQLRLRDVGGVIVNDFIDMRSLKHRRDLETRFKDNLKKDRARTTTAPVSPFGVIEMTRQRMRGSHESMHFAVCPTCRGRGLLQKPDSVAADGLRELQAILSSDRVFRVELVVSPRIAGELLSSKRKALSRVERAMAKRVDVRVSEAIPLDRVSFYAYDERGADVDVSKLQVRTASEDELVTFEAPDLENWAEEPELPAEPTDEPEETELTAIHPLDGDDDQLDRDRGVPQQSAQTQARSGDRREDREEGGRRRGGRGRGRGERGERGGGRGGRGRGRDHGPAQDSDSGNEPREPRESREDRRDEPRDGEQRPQGHPSDNGEQNGEQRRGRRRRRRGGRGRRRGGGQDGAPVGPDSANADGPYSDDSRDEGDDRGPEGRDDRERSHDDDRADRTEHSEPQGNDGAPMGDEGGEGREPRQPSDSHGEDGAGGDRPRRGRRRRGGRGRGRGRGTGGQEGAPSHASDSGEAPNRDDAQMNRDGDDRPMTDDRADDRGESSDDRDDRDGPRDERDDRVSRDERGEANDPNGQNGEGGGRRRGRRRGGRGRGRGGRGDSGNGGEGGGGGQPNRDQRGQSNDRGNQPRSNNSQGQRDRRDGGGHGGSGNSGSRPANTGSTPTPPPAGPRTLYGGGRRKLSPGELRTRPKSDE